MQKQMQRLWMVLNGITFCNLCFPTMFVICNCLTMNSFPCGPYQADRRYRAWITGRKVSVIVSLPLLYLFEKLTFFLYVYERPRRILYIFEEYFHWNITHNITDGSVAIGEVVGVLEDINLLMMFLFIWESSSYSTSTFYHHHQACLYYLSHGR